MFDIPDSARRFMSTKFRQYRELIPKESSPAATRAHTLVALQNEDRTVQTAVCQDPYWSETNLNKIYPWATLQLMFVEDWKTLSDDYSRTKFASDWNDRFLNPLTDIYKGDGLPTLERGAGKVLEQMRFTKITAVDICKKRQNPRVGFREIQSSLGKLQELYNKHIVQMWRIINSLIITIVDPVKKTEMIRLHPNAANMSNNVSTRKYVDAIAKEARERIADFYIQVETIYTDTVKLLKDLDN